MATEYEKIKPRELYYLTVDWGNRKYKNYEKKFNDEKHYENWYDFINSRGGKVVGICTKEMLNDEDK